MTSKNEITGDLIKTKGSSEEYRNNWDAIFGPKVAKKDLHPDLDKGYDGKSDSEIGSCGKKCDSCGTTC